MQDDQDRVQQEARSEYRVVRAMLEGTPVPLTMNGRLAAFILTSPTVSPPCCPPVASATPDPEVDMEDVDHHEDACKRLPTWLQAPNSHTDMHPSKVPLNSKFTGTPINIKQQLRGANMDLAQRNPNVNSDRKVLCLETTVLQQQWKRNYEVLNYGKVTVVQHVRSSQAKISLLGLPSRLIPFAALSTSS
ncbi:hypothetical protein GQ600_1764 [Phytophthora cactorum]|nr:hypothetical protein GQ600_1764 [Phytophthora cactorum]